MRFDPIDTFDPARQAGDLVVRPRRWPSLLIGILSLGIGVGMLAFVPDVFFRFVTGGFLVLVGLIFLSVYRRLRSPRAWLLAVDGQGLIVMLRSPLRAPADEREQTVLTLPWRHVAWVRPARERRVVTRRRSGKVEQRVETYRYLDVAVRDVDLDALRQKVDAASETPSSWKNDHRQSQLVDGDVLRLHYSGPNVTNAPSLKKLLPTLAGHATVRDEIDIG